MDNKTMIHGIEDLNFDLWQDTLDPDFVQMSHDVGLKYRWKSYQHGIRGIEGSILKPVNNYVRNLVPRPELIDTENEMRLRFYSHADFWLRVKDDGSLWHVDRPWQRQYYNTAYQPEVDPNLAFEPTFIFYTPWVLDFFVEVNYCGIDDSPFLVHNKTDLFHPIKFDAEYTNPHMVAFNFKKVGDHMREPDFGIINKPAPMFDMILPNHDIIKERIREFYAKY